MSTHINEDKGPRVNAANYAFLVLSTIAVILRFCGRFVGHKAGFWWDDWLSLTALVSRPHLTLLNFRTLTFVDYSLSSGQSVGSRSTGCLLDLENTSTRFLGHMRNKKSSSWLSILHTIPGLLWSRCLCFYSTSVFSGLYQYIGLSSGLWLSLSSAGA